MGNALADFAALEGMIVAHLIMTTGRSEGLYDEEGHSYRSYLVNGWARGLLEIDLDDLWERCFISTPPEP